MLIITYKNLLILFKDYLLSTEAKEDIDGLKYNDFEKFKELAKISKYSKQLYEEGYLLYNKRLNKRKKSPSVFNKQIVLEYHLPNDKYLSKHFDFYV